MEVLFLASIFKLEIIVGHRDFDKKQPNMISDNRMPENKKLSFSFTSLCSFLFLYLLLMLAAGVCVLINKYIYSSFYANIDYRSFSLCYGLIINSFYLLCCCSAIAFIHFFQKGRTEKCVITSYHIMAMYIADFIIYSLVLFVEQENAVLNSNLFTVEIVWLGRLFELMLVIGVLLVFYRNKCQKFSGIFRKCSPFECLIVLIYIIFIDFYFLVFGSSITLLHEFVNTFFILYCFSKNKSSLKDCS